MKTRALVLGALGALSLHAQILIDDFNTGDFSVVGVSVPFETHVGGGIGGSRRLAIYNPTSSGVATSASVSGGVLAVNKPNNSSVVWVRYGALNIPVGGGETSGTDLNLDAGLNNHVQVTVTAMSAPFTIGVVFVDGLGLFSSAVLSFDAPGTRQMPLTGPANLSDLAGIEIDLPLLSPQVGSFQIDSIQLVPVPEPETYALVGAIGLLTFGLVRRHFAARQFRSYPLL